MLPLEVGSCPAGAVYKHWLGHLGRGIAERSVRGVETRCASKDYCVLSGSRRVAELRGEFALRAGRETTAGSELHGYCVRLLSTPYSDLWVLARGVVAQDYSSGVCPGVGWAGDTRGGSLGPLGWL